MVRAADAPSFRWSILALTALVVSITLGTDPAEARGRRRTWLPYSPPYAAIVVDANTSQTLHADQADRLRHPASLAKIMTLFLLFEQLDAGKLKLDSPLSVSAKAARQEPSKLGLTPGDTIEVEDAIKALVIRSANDVAVVVAEAIAGDEVSFARLMTHKARSLGMNRTIYRNASGLPHREQVTTARDQALLGRLIQDRFPNHYHYFATPKFDYHGVSSRNHNRLLGDVEGVDGIKTGYTRDSGFNIIISVRRDSRRIIAVVLGGASSRDRDARMRDLIAEHMTRAKSVRRPGTTSGRIAAHSFPSHVYNVRN
jgi:D-alanyl-D-alanine carboxypeptidase